MTTSPSRAASPPPSPHDAPNPFEADDDARTERHLAVLRELVDLGMNLVRQLHAQAAATEGAPIPIEPHIQIARAIRHAIALEAWVAKSRGTARTARQAAAARTTHALQSRQTDYLRHRVGAAIDAFKGPSFTLRQHLEGRLTDPALEAAFARRPFEQIVATICHDLGIPPPAPAEHYNEQAQGSPLDPSCEARIRVTGASAPRPASVESVPSATDSSECGSGGACPQWGSGQSPDLPDLPTPDHPTPLAFRPPTG